MPARLLHRMGNWLILAVSIAAAVACSNSKHEDGGGDAQKRASEMAVSVLPPGVETTWKAYVDGRFSRAIRPQGDVVRVRDDATDAMHTTVLISRNSPYEISCDPITGGTIQFGQGDSATSVTVYGLGSSEARPPIGVPTNSIAAKQLSEAMCLQMAARMHDVMHEDH